MVHPERIELPTVGSAVSATAGFPGFSRRRSVVIEGALEAGGQVVGTAGVQCGCGSRGPVVGGSELSAKLVGIEACVSEDAVQRSSLELLVERDDEEGLAVGMAQPDVAASLADNLPADSFECADELRAGDDRQPVGHAGSGSLRRTTPVSSVRPSSRRPSMYRSSASRAFSVASSSVSPWVCRPGRSGA